MRGGQATVTDWLLVGAGGFLGANLRHLTSIWAARRYGTAFPYGTLVANLAGCLAMGMVMGALAAHTGDSDEARLLLATGFLGGLTTFSTFGFQTVELIREGRTGAALANVFSSTALGLGAVTAGLLAAYLVTDVLR
jgi:CrcB protein